MKTRHSFIPFVLFSMWLCGGATLRAQDPIIQTKYTADPAPMVYNDTVFLTLMLKIMVTSLKSHGKKLLTNGQPFLLQRIRTLNAHFPQPH